MTNDQVQSSPQTPVSLKRFGDYVHGLRDQASEVVLGDDPLITQVTYDSREVVDGALFICKGVHFSPVYLRQALDRGAVAYVAERSFTAEEVGRADIPHALVSDIRQAIADLGATYYSREWDRLNLIGITGTKGKSTTISFLHSILAAAARRRGEPRPGILSTIRYEDGVIDGPAVRTTPETLDLYAHLHNAVTSGLQQMCLEVSSQGLRYKRVAGLSFEVGCFLNVSQDHISPQEHPDYEDYLSAKLSLFDQTKIAVVNAHTQELARVKAAASKCSQVVWYGLEDGAEVGGGSDVGGGPDVGGGSGVGPQRAGGEPGAGGESGVGGEGAAGSGVGEIRVAGYDVVPTEEGQEFTARIFGAEHRFSIGLRGAFNVDNALAAIAMALVLGVSIEDMREGLAAARVPGRMQVFHLPRGTTVIVDYAHQKLSLEALLATVKRDYPGAPITMVIGACGNKGLNRREEIGLLAGREADDIIFTEDDPGDVPVVEICHDLDRYVQSTGHAPARIEPDRRTAIELALTSAPDNGLVLILGKGIEKWQLRGASAVETESDIDIIESLLP